MKQYFTGFITGACLVASAVMFMGASDFSDFKKELEGRTVGLFQLSTTKSGGNTIYETVIDTRTGEVVSRECVRDGNYKFVDNHVKY